MENSKKIPRCLYKYRDLDNRMLKIIVGDQIYYADPGTFNDPLDAQPSVEIDLGNDELERIVRVLEERRSEAEMSAAAKTFQVRGSKTIDHIKQRSRKNADQLIQEINYSSSNPEYESEDSKALLFGQYIKEALISQYDKGIVSFAERSTCPLMWSHYGDQHRGVCIGYSVPVNAVDNLHKVKYGGSRMVKASQVAAMLNGCDTARSEINEAVLLRKAKSWGYEREWRLIGPRGPRNSPLELEELIFGMRCNPAVKYSVMKALEDRERPIKFFEMREKSGKFSLEKRKLNYGDELFSHFPKRSLSIYEMFES